VLYDCGVDYDDFQGAVLELADGGTRLTKGSVALRLKVEPASAGVMLDRMTRDGQLELDIDERSGEIFYEPRRARRPAGVPASRSTPATPASSALAEIEKALDTAALASKIGVGAALVKARLGGDGIALPPEQQRKIGLGVVLGGLLPGLGLFYSAPLPVAIAASLVVLVGFKILAIIPFLSPLLLIPFLAVCAVASAVLGGLYTWQYNQKGKRSPLGDEPLSPKQLLKRLRK